MQLEPIFGLVRKLLRTELASYQREIVISDSLHITVYNWDEYLADHTSLLERRICEMKHADA